MKAAQVDPLYVELFEIQPRKGDRTKFRILEACIGSLSSEGVEGTNYESIGKRVGLARRNVAYHYPKFDDLLQSAIQLAAAQGQRLGVQALVEAKTPEAKLRAYFQSMFTWIDKHPAQARVMVALYHLATHSERFRALNTRIRSAATGRIEQLVRELSPKCPDAGSTAVAVYAILFDGAFRALSTQDSRDVKELTRSTFHSALTLIKASAQR